ncbi:MAG: hypothetical protein P8M13_06305 [Luminiphilus sp.]|nr:hypothetical protein [Luminiphilus sp.]
MMRSLIAIAVLLASVSLSAEEYEWDVTIGEHGIPSEIFYSDERMSISLKPQAFLPRQGGGWKVDLITIEAIVDENLHPDTVTAPGVATSVAGISSRASYSESRSLGVKPQFTLVSSNHVVVTDAPVRCRGLTLRQWGPKDSFRTPSLLKEALVDGMEVMKVIDMWREPPPQFAKTGSYKAKGLSMGNFAGRLEIISPNDLTTKQLAKDGVWYRDGSCSKALERSRIEAQKKAKLAEQEAKARQDLLDSADRAKEKAMDDGDVLLLTNQRLLRCAFDPVCEKKLLAGVDECKKSNQGNFVESCVRAIEISR